MANHGAHKPSVAGGAEHCHMVTHMIHQFLLAAVVWLPVVDVVLAPVLLVDRAVIVAVHHAVHAEHVRLVFLHYSFRF